MGYESEFVADGVKMDNLKDTSKLNNRYQASLNDVQKNYNEIINEGERIEVVTEATGRMNMAGKTHPV